MIGNNCDIGDYEEILLIRHGSTAANASGKYSGRFNLPLSPKGEEQVLQLSENLDAATYENWFGNPDGIKIISSPLQRCRQTASILWPNQPVMYEPLFIETDFGQWEGMTYDQLQNDPLYKQWLMTAPYEKPAPPNGESGAQIAQRVKRGWLQARQYYDANKVTRLAIVAHGGVIMYLMSEIVGSTEDFYKWQLTPAGAWRLSREGYRLC